MHCEENKKLNLLIKSKKLEKLGFRTHKYLDPKSDYEEIFYEYELQKKKFNEQKIQNEINKMSICMESLFENFKKKRQHDLDLMVTKFIKNNPTRLKNFRIGDLKDKEFIKRNPDMIKYFKKDITKDICNKNIQNENINENIDGNNEIIFNIYI